MFCELCLLPLLVGDVSNFPAIIFFGFHNSLRYTLHTETPIIVKSLMGLS